MVQGFHSCEDYPLKRCYQCGGVALMERVTHMELSHPGGWAGFHVRTALGSMHSCWQVGPEKDQGRFIR